jgi:hypothetical protein
MATKKAEAKLPPRFVLSRGDGYHITAVATLETAIKKAEERLNNPNYRHDRIAIYQLVAIVEPEKVPIKVTKIAATEVAEVTEVIKKKGTKS